MEPGRLGRGVWGATTFRFMRALGATGLGLLAVVAVNAFGFRGVGAQPDPDRPRWTQDERTVVGRFSGGGQWRRQGEMREAGDGSGGGGESRSWRVHAIERDDGSVRAKLSLLGVFGFGDLTIEGHVVGNEAFGVLLDASGAQVDSFNATFDSKGTGGSFTLGSGESGAWDYDLRTAVGLKKAGSPLR